MATRNVTRRTAPRRKLVWARTGPNSANIGAVGTTRVDLLSNFQTTYGAQLIGCTVMRIRGTWTYVSAVADVLLPITAGIRVFDEAHNIATLPGPVDDPHADWMYYQTLYTNYTQVAGTTYGAWTEFDVRSRRKVEELGQGLALAFQSQGAAARNLTYQASVLLALP